MTNFELTRTDKNPLCLRDIRTAPKICKKKAHFKSLHLIKWLFSISEDNFTFVESEIL